MKIIEFKKILLGILIPILGFYGKGQVGIGTSDPRGALDINSPITSNFGLVLPTNESILNMTTPQGGSSVPGTIMYDSTEDCIRLYKKALTGGEPGWSNCLEGGVTTNHVSVVVDCDAVENGFNGVYTVGKELTSANTFRIRITNNSFSQATIALSPLDLTLSGVSGVEVTSVSSPSITLIAGESGVITYTLSGKPTNCGILSGEWNKVSLNCVKTVIVNPSANCSEGAWFDVLPEYGSQGLMNGQSYTGTYRIPYERVECEFPAESITVDGLTLTYLGDSSSSSSTIDYVLSGTYTGVNNGSVSFNSSFGCIIYLGPTGSCKELLVNNPETTSGIYYTNLNVGGSQDIQRVYCDMETDGGGWTLVAVNGGRYDSTNQKSEILALDDRGYLPRSKVVKIATTGNQVQLRTGGLPPNVQHKLTSQPNGVAIQALRNTTTTHRGLGTWHREGAVADFTGNTVIRPVGTWSWYIGYCESTSTGWPSMYHSCGNTNDVHWMIDYNMNRTSARGEWSSTWVR